MTLAACPYCKSNITGQCFGSGAGDTMNICRNCGGWFVFPPPTAEDMLSYYRTNADHGLAIQLRDWRAGTSQSNWYTYLAAHISEWFYELAAPGTCIRVADVGAGDLELTLELAHILPEAQLTAFDLHPLENNKLPADFVNRVQTELIDLNRLDMADSIDVSTGFNLVVCVSVIEHVISPLKLLDFLFRITLPGGLVYVVGPDVNSWARRILGRRWPYYCPQVHLTLPTRSSIKLAVAQICPCAPAMVNPLMVRYSVKYLLRYLGMHLPLPQVFDIALPVPAGAFELIWKMPS